LTGNHDGPLSNEEVTQLNTGRFGSAVFLRSRLRRQRGGPLEVNATELSSGLERGATELDVPVEKTIAPHRQVQVSHELECRMGTTSMRVATMRKCVPGPPATSRAVPFPGLLPTTRGVRFGEPLRFLGVGRRPVEPLCRVGSLMAFSLLASEDRATAE
jgi:hypothetical protein